MSGQEAQSSGAPVDIVHGVRLFAELDRDEVAAIAGLFKERTFPKGETVIKEGSGGAAFYLIESGEVTVTIGGELRATLGPGDYFGEVALIDEGDPYRDDHGYRRPRLLRAHALGAPPARRDERRDRLETIADARQGPARGRAGDSGASRDAAKHAGDRLGGFERRRNKHQSALVQIRRVGWTTRRTAELDPHANTWLLPSPPGAEQPIRIVGSDGGDDRAATLGPMPDTAAAGDLPQRFTGRLLREGAVGRRG